VRQKERCFLDAVVVYCDAVRKLAGDLAAADVRSTGLMAFRRYLADYVATEEFSATETEMGRLIGEWEQVRYALDIDGKRVTVGRCEPEPVSTRGGSKVPTSRSATPPCRIAPENLRTCFPPARAFICSVQDSHSSACDDIICMWDDPARTTGIEPDLFRMFAVLAEIEAVPPGCVAISPH
jgi:hypothetical protein